MTAQEIAKGRELVEGTLRKEFPLLSEGEIRELSKTIACAALGKEWHEIEADQNAASARVI